MPATKIRSVLVGLLLAVALSGGAVRIDRSPAAAPPKEIGKAARVPGPAGERVILDQEQARYDGGTSARALPGYTVWQSFTAGKTGTLVHIDMGFFNEMSGAGELRIYAGAGTSGKVLQALKVNVVGSDQREVTWNRWSVRAPVVAGHCYTFEFRPDPKTLPGPYGVAIGPPNPYRGGRFGLTDPSQSTATDHDAVFGTWVDLGAGAKQGAGPAHASDEKPR